ncbi:MAG: VacJ family lipoprotein [Candidatus Rokubacteria bacterium]|nr:VacJ family lipoprotein [Candidatus Rokubacteria bacterium]
MPGSVDRRTTAVLSFALSALLLGGCGSLSGSLRVDSALLAARPVPAPGGDPVAPARLPAAREGDARVDVSGAGQPAAGELASPVIDSPAIVAGSEPAVPADGGTGADPAVAQTQRAPQEKIPTKDNEVDEEYDPWEPFNETTFEFNRRLDRYILKPVAKAYNVVMPEPFQILIANGFDNIGFVPRAVNSLLQGKWGGAGREVSRFLINSTLGIGGLFDAAKYWNIEKSKEDFGQTLAVWGSAPGPYLIVPFVEPLTVRDGIGKAVDGAMDPLSYVLPFFWTRLGMSVGDTVNDRSLNLDLFQGFEESVIDMYSAVRHGYLRRREKLIRE